VDRMTRLLPGGKSITSPLLINHPEATPSRSLDDFVSCATDNEVIVLDAPTVQPLLRYALQSGSSTMGRPQFRMV